jgi:hypothetical protein
MAAEGTSMTARPARLGRNGGGEKPLISLGVVRNGEVRVQINAQPRDLASILVEGCGRWSTGEVEF